MKNKILLTLFLFSFNVMPLAELYSQNFYNDERRQMEDVDDYDPYYERNTDYDVHPIFWVIFAVGMYYLFKFCIIVFKG